MKNIGLCLCMTWFLEESVSSVILFLFIMPFMACIIKLKRCTAITTDPSPGYNQKFKTYYNYLKIISSIQANSIHLGMQRRIAQAKSSNGSVMAQYGE